MSKRHSNKKEENRLPKNCEQQLEEQLSKGIFYMCKYHNNDESALKSSIVSGFNTVKFEKYYLSTGEWLDALKCDYEGFASIIIIINNYCCQKAFLATRQIHWRIFYNKTLKKVAKVIINGFVYGPQRNENHISDPLKRNYVMTSGKRFKGQPQLAKLEINRKEVPFVDNTIAICGRGYTNVERQVSYDKNITLCASHPIAVVVGALIYELNKFCKKMTIKEITDICIGKIKANAEFEVDLECEVLGIAGMFLHCTSPTVAIIINHYTYPEKINYREGSAHDVFAVSNFFRANMVPHFIVEDGNVGQVHTLMNWVKNADFTDFERLIIVIMAHGGPEGAIYANDGIYNLYTDIRDQLLMNDTLQNVDKLIFVNKCRGDRETKITDQESEDQNNKKLESKEDTMDNNNARNDDKNYPNIFNSCEEGYVSKLFKYTGAPFIQSLIRTFQQNNASINMKEAFEKVIETVYEQMDVMDFYQLPEHSPFKGDMIWNVENIDNLYKFKYEQLQVGNMPFSTRPYIGLMPDLAEGKFYSGTNEAGLYEGDREENIKEKYAYYVLLRNIANIKGGGAISAEQSKAIQKLLTSLVLQSWFFKRKTLNYAVTPISTKYMVVNCFDQDSMNAIKQIEYNQNLLGMEIEIVPLLQKSHVLTISVPKNSFRTVLEWKNDVAEENPQLQSHMWDWRPLPGSGKWFCVELSLLDMERLERNSRNISYRGETLKIKKQHQILEKKSASKIVKNKIEKYIKI